MPSIEIHNEQEQFRKIASGDEHAFHQFFQKYSGLVFSYLYEHTDSQEWAEDMTQEIFTQLWLARETLAAINNMRAYLYVMARHHSLNQFKTMVRERQRRLIWAKQERNRALPDPQDTLETALTFIDLAINNLPSQQQKVWVLSRRERKSYREISEEMGISTETVKKYLQYATQSIINFVKERMPMAFFLLLLYMWKK